MCCSWKYNCGNWRLQWSGLKSDNLSDSRLLRATRVCICSTLFKFSFFQNNQILRSLIEIKRSPGRGGQTEVTPDQTSFERTHVPGALKLHGLEKASSALSSGQWSGTCLIRGHFGLGRSDQRQFRTHTSLIRAVFERTLVWSGDVFERTLVWSEDVSSALLSDQRRFERTFVWSERRFDRTFVWSERRFERTFVWSEDVSSTFLSDQRRFERTFVWSEDVSRAEIG